MLRGALGTVLLLSGLKLVELPGAGITIAVGVGVGLAIVAAYLLRETLRGREASVGQAPG